jgi:1,4-alpha-glucan branching enzyme
MPVSQEHINDRTPMGAALHAGGATFRTWAPAAREVYVVIAPPRAAGLPAGWAPPPQDALVPHGDGTWTGFVPGITDGTPYRFWIVGAGSRGFKRDPYARELGLDPGFPDCDCIVRSSDFPWHDDQYRTPDFRDLVIYQLHIGTYYATDAAGRDQRMLRRGKFLDLLFRLDHLRTLGVNAIQPLPVQEFPSEFSEGYNGTDYFSPETDYHVSDPAELQRYLDEANRVLAGHGKAALTLADLGPAPNQLKVIVDLYHLDGIAVLFDVVYNHAGGGFDDQSIYRYDRRVFHDNNDSQFFTDNGWAGGLVFAYWNANVCGFLGDNAAFLLEEYHLDGLRYDEVSVIDRFGGWSFGQSLSSRVRAARPQAIQIAEYWNNSRWLAVQPPPGGLGFDAAWSDRLRLAVRGLLAGAAQGAAPIIDFDSVAAALSPPPNFRDAWRAVHCLENHDIVVASHEDRQPRIALLAGGNDPRSWYARSRARVATGLLLTAPGIPMLFMGEEILEDKFWSDDPQFWQNTLIWWDGLAQDAVMRDFLAFTRDAVRTRRELPALRAEQVNPFHIHDANRVIAFHRWIEGAGQDVVVVASLNESTFWRYELGFPEPGYWREVLNSDYYDSPPNPRVAGNGGGVDVGGAPLHGFAQSASITIPANSILIFALR